MPRIDLVAQAVDEAGHLTHEGIVVKVQASEWDECQAIADKIRNEGDLAEYNLQQ